MELYWNIRFCIVCILTFVEYTCSLSCHSCEYIDIGSSNLQLNDQLQSYAYGERDCVDDGDSLLCTANEDSCGKLHTKLTAKINGESFHMDMYLRGCTNRDNMTANTCHNTVSDFVNAKTYEATLEFLTGETPSISVEGDYCVCSDKDNCNTASNVMVNLLVIISAIFVMFWELY